jgi:hypothetical protein
MNRKTIVICCFIGVFFSFAALSETPTPLPGTPLALTCDEFTHFPDLGAVEVITNWNWLDRSCVLLENNSGSAIEIAGVQAYVSQTQFPLITQIRIWEVLNEQYLPNVPQAAILVSEIYDFGVEPVPGNPEVALVTFDLENYPGFAPMPVINANRKFVVDLINVNDSSSMKTTAEWDGRCPPSFWEDQTNIFANFDAGATTWHFKEDIGQSTNFYIGVTYYTGATPRVPAMGTAGVIGLLVLISLGLLGKKQNRG